ncbi:MAG: hypothetical protein KDA24_07805 [Deltaproteobacteria bacterium]|nr:hypothetical protein [Deltaproteobacteria bacterium]
MRTPQASSLQMTMRLFVALMMFGVFGVGCPGDGADDDGTAIDDDDDATGDDDDATGDDDDATGDDDDATGDDDDATGDDDDSGGDDDDATGPLTDTVIFDFEGDAPTFTGFGGAGASAVVDPTDSSNMVAEIGKGAAAETWAGVTMSACEGDTVAVMPFTATETSLSIDAWSPDAAVPFLVKIENSADGSQFAEAQGTVSAASAWETLTVDYSAATGGTFDPAVTYDRISIFPNFGTSGADAGGVDKNYYVDDVWFLGTVYSTDCPAAGDDDDSAGDDDDSAGDDDDSAGGGDTVVFDFEGVAPTFTGFGGAGGSAVVDPTDATNMVAELGKGAAAETWAGVTMSACAGDTVAVMPFTATETELSIDVWSPDPAVPFMIKIENSGNGAQYAEAQGTVSAASNWETLTIDYSAATGGTFDPTVTYDRISIFPNFGTSGADAGGVDKTYYVDDVWFLGTMYSTACPAAVVATGVPITFDDSSTTYSFVGFGDASGAAVVDPTDSSNMVAQLDKVASSPTWAGVTISTGGALDSIAALPLTATDLEMTVDVWSPVSNIDFLLKVEDSTNAGIFIEKQATFTGTASTWQTVTFDLSAPFPNGQGFAAGNTYDKLSIFPYFGVDGASGGTGTFYVDDIQMAP